MGDGVVHRILLIRHGETVDNVAALYAGTRDSALTTHGILQAKRLGAYLAENGVVLTHLFSSNLSRAVKTAEAIRAAQPSSTITPLDLTQCENLREQDFGYYEGKSFMARKVDATTSATERNRAEHQHGPDFQPVETKEAMAIRSNQFLDQQLMPTLKTEGAKISLVIAIVSHGMLLSSLWKSILKRQKRQSITLSPDVSREHAVINLEHLGGWSNTGYLDLSFRIMDARSRVRDAASEAIEPALKSAPATTEELGHPDSISFAITVQTINGKEHLKGLKRTRGGVGSSKHDEKQRSLHSFFAKKSKIVHSHDSAHNSSEDASSSKD